MKQKEIILLFTVIVAIVLSIYIMGEETKEPEMGGKQVGYDHEPTVQIANRGEINVTLIPGFVQIGRLQAQVPSSWKRENPSSSLRIAQFVLPGWDGVGELVVFSGIGGSVDANLERWYGQFKSETQQSVSESAVISHEHFKKMDVTFSYAEGTYLKSSMGMDGTKTEMIGYALLAAIVSSSDGLYFFKGTGPKSTMVSQKKLFKQFIRSIEKL